jgi:hypothetical protein
MPHKSPGTGIVTTIPKEDDMRWEQWFCSEQECSTGEWMVQRSPVHREVWLVTPHVEASPYTVAASIPVCPLCGTTLQAAATLEEGMNKGIGAKARPIFDVVGTFTA